MVIRVLRDATVVANAVTAANAAAPESVTVAVAVTATCPANGSDVPPVAEIVTAPPAAGINTVYTNEPDLAPVVVLELAAVVMDTAVRLSAGCPTGYVRAPLTEIPPEVNKFDKVVEASSLPAESRGVT